MNKRGVALILGLIIITLLAIIAGAQISRSIWESKTVKGHTESMQAFWLAEAGINDCLNRLRTNYSLTGIGNTAKGEGGYTVTITSNADGSKTVVAQGFIPFTAPYRKTRSITAVMNKFPSIPEHFYDNVIYCSGDVDVGALNNRDNISGDVRYGEDVIPNPPPSGSIVNGSAISDASTSPLAHLDFEQLRTLSQGQGNYYDAQHLSGPFPTSFWYNETEGIPNVVFLEGNLSLSGNETVGGFIVVGGEVICDVDITGNISILGAVYSLGGFTLKGGGNALNIDGGVWAGQDTTLTGNAKLSYNATYMNAIKNLGINTTVQVISWQERLNPYQLLP